MPIKFRDECLWQSSHDMKPMQVDKWSAGFKIFPEGKDNPEHNYITLSEAKEFAKWVLETYVE